MQSDWKDCGLYCLQSFYEKYYFNEIDISYLKNNVEYGKKGINILQLEALAKIINLKIEPFKIKFNELMAMKYKKPIIVLIKKSDYSHYVILYHKNKRYVNILDPSQGKIQIAINEFKKIFLDIILIVEKNNKILKIIDKNIFLSLFWDDKRIWLFMILLYVGISIMTLISPYFLKLIIDKVIPNNGYKLLNFLFLFFLWLVIVKLCFISISTIIKNKKSLSLKIKLKNIIVHNFINARYKDIQKLSTMDWFRRLGIVDTLIEYYLNLLSVLTRDIIIIFSSIIFLFIVNIEMIYISIFTAILLSFISLLFARYRKQKIRHNIEHNLSLNLSYYDILNQHLSLKDPSSARKMKDDNKLRLNKLIKNELSIKTIFNYNNFISEFVLQISYILIIYIGTIESISNKINFSSLILSLSMFSLFSISFNNVNNTFTNWNEIKNNSDLLKFVMFLRKENLNEKGIKIQKINEIMIKDLTFEYEKGNKVLNIKNLLIKENISLKGINGSGKSTLLKILYHYLEYKGSIYINNINLNEIDLKYLRENIYISSNFWLPNIKIKDFLTNNNVELNTLTSNLHKYKIDKILERSKISINDIIINNGSNYSLGQKKILSLLPLLSKKFSLLLLDEIFNNIDKNNVKLLSNAILNYQSDSLIISISHGEENIFKFKKEYRIE